MRIIADIKRAFDAKLYYPALTVALTLPDICVALCFATADEQVKKTHYEDFIAQYADPMQLGVDGSACYRLRCGMVHRGNASGHQFIGVDNVIFTVPETGAALHGAIIDNTEEFGKKAMMLDLAQFCLGMERAVIKWYNANRNSPIVQANIPSVLRLRPKGVKAFVDGAVVASGPE